MKSLSSILAIVLLLQAFPAFGNQRIEVNVAKSSILTIPGITKVVVTNPAIADIAVLSKKELLLNGKKPGSTSLIVWTKEKCSAYDLVVNADSDLLRIALKRALAIRDVNLNVIGNRIILSGKVNNTAQVEMAGKIAQGFAENVVNLLSEENLQQVQVDVQVVELRKNNGHDVGVNWGSMRSNSSGEVTFEKDLMSFSETAAGRTVTFSQFDRLAAQLKLLVTEGVATVLAKPKLVTVSGGKASFLVGGQIPVPQAQQFGQVTVTWRDYGVKLSIEPTVKDNGRIALKVKPEVSSLDYSNAIQINGFSIPSLSSREAETQVVLDPGEGLAIGGLIQNMESKVVEKLPLLGEIPILGTLFKSTKFQKDETELTILVTPRLVVTGAEKEGRDG